MALVTYPGASKGSSQINQQLANLPAITLGIIRAEDGTPARWPCG